MVPQKEKRMCDKSLEPRKIRIINQLESPSIAELSRVTKRVSNRNWSLAFPRMFRKCAQPISGPSLVHASDLLFALPVEALQQLRHQRLPVQCFVPASPAKPLRTLPWMF